VSRSSAKGKVVRPTPKAKSKMVPIPKIGVVTTRPKCEGKPFGKTFATVSLCNHREATLRDCDLRQKDLRQKGLLKRAHSHICLRRERKLLHKIQRDCDELMVRRCDVYQIRQYLEFVSHYRVMCTCTAIAVESAIKSMQCLLTHMGKTPDEAWYYRAKSRLSSLPSGALPCYYRVPHQH